MITMWLVRVQYFLIRKLIQSMSTVNNPIKIKLLTLLIVIESTDLYQLYIESRIHLNNKTRLISKFKAIKTAFSKSLIADIRNNVNKTQH